MSWPQNKVLVSVVMSVHNGARTLPAALASIAAQTYQHMEIIVVDDGSRDGTPSLLAAYNRRPIRVITNPKRLGLTASLNKAVRQAHGTYIARLDADDTWHPEKLTRQVAYASAHPSVGVLGTFYTNNSQQIHLPVTEAQIKRRIWLRNPFGHSCVLIRKDVLESVDWYDEKMRYAQDRDLWFRLLPHTGMHNLPEYLVARRVSRTSPDKQKEQMRANMSMIIKYARMYRPGPWVYLGLIEPVVIYLLRTVHGHFSSQKT